MGVYIQPIVQGTSYHCEFNLFYDPENPRELNRVKELSTSAVKNLMAKGAFFSRPYGESAGMILNRDAATVVVLNKLKKELGKGVTFKTSSHVNKGLYVGIKGEDVYYDFTDEALIDALKVYLSPFILEVLKQKE